MKLRFTLMLIFTGLLLVGQAQAQDTQPGADVDDQQEIEAAAQVEQKNELQAEEKTPVAAKALAVAPGPAEIAITKLGEIIQLYGQLRLDSAYDSTRSFGGGNWVFWVLRDYKGTVGGREFNDDSTQELNIHARNTRFGFNVGAIPISSIGADVSGRFEIDFYGGDVTVATWKALPRLRVGAVTLNWGLIEIMAGNNWDTFSTLIAHGDDNGVHWWGGNLGARRPQLRLTVKPKLGDNMTLYVQSAVARSFDIADPDYDGMGNSSVDLNGDGKITASDEYGRATGEGGSVGNGTNDGEDSAIPQLQWRLALEAKLWTKALHKIALSGHWQQGYFTKPVGSLQRETMNSYHVGAELDFPILDVVAVRGEAFYGQALKDVMGGIAQDLNPATGEEIQVAGGWAELVVTPTPNWWVALGGSGEYPIADTMQVATAKQLEALRFSNQYGFLTSSYTFGSGFGVSLGYLIMLTEYHIAKDVSSLDAGFVTHYAINHRVVSNIFFKF